MCGKNLLFAVYFLLSLSVVHLYARPTQQYRQWAQGIFDLPHEVARATTVSQLQPFLESDREFTRMAGVRRLGQIEGPRSIPILLDLFAKEKFPMGSETAPLVKLEVIRILGQIHTDGSKSALLGLLQGYWQNGPRVKDKKGYRLDADFTHVLDTILRTMIIWRDDPAVFETLQDLALRSEVKDCYTDRRGVGQTIWEAYLRVKMAKDGITEDELSLAYLLDFMDAVPQASSYRTLDNVKYCAAYAVLQEYSESALSSSMAKLQKQLIQEEATTSGDTLSQRNQALRRRIICIGAALKEKAKLREVSGTRVSSAERPQPSPDASR